MLFEQERKHKMVEYLQQNHRASVQELGEVFHVSESTVRRDLKELEDGRLLKRTHGGAISLQSVDFEPNMVEKEDSYREEKENIARRAAELVIQGDTILLDSGTTTLPLARALRSRSGIRVITNSVIVLGELKDCRNIELSIIGGLLRPDTQAFVGPMAERTLDMIRVDKAFIATNGLDIKEGITTPNLIEAAIKRKMIDISKQVILLADHSKIGGIAYAKFADLTDIDYCITDGGASVSMIQQFRKQGLDMIIA
ncbi:DeoR/GlpR family DNA-binding transcription regulator [Paenibacillus campi]|uniref:DeoR/GlpR family DNA-binding transcription regulator n=1 Tax=Paenibacillus campi TaxID=3106031 RepID=UPI002AFF04AB|nr:MULTISPECIES: DeoR/GlpR family DNA-binding transcription regulator [unclassified Paenibacillus]